MGISSSVCAHRSGAESRRRTRSRGLLGLSSSSLLLHTPPTPAPPLGTCLLPEFLFLSYSIHSFLFFFFCHLPVYPPIPPFLYFWLTVAPPLSLASGPSHNQQHAWDSLHCLAYFHMIPRKLWIFAYKAFLLSFHCVTLLLCSLILSPYYLFFVITMRLPQPLPLIFSAGFEYGSLCRTH